MAKNKFGGMGGLGNMGNMLKQAQKMQEDMLKKQEELAGMVVEATSGGGVVTVTASGAKEILSISIKPEAVDPDDVEMLEDLVLVAVNDALKQIEEKSRDELGKLTGGLPFF